MLKLLQTFLILSIAITLISCVAPNVVLRLEDGIDTIELGDTHYDRGIRAKYGVLDIEYVVISNSVNNQVVGQYQIVYEAIHNNISYQITRMVFVVDDTLPILTLNIGLDTIIVGEQWIDAGVTVLDNSQAVLPVEVKGSVDTQTAGTYTIVYEATDPSGNKGMAQRIVFVLDPLEVGLWPLLNGIEFTADDDVYGQGLYFYMEDDLPIMIYMVYGEGTSIITLIRFELRILSGGLFLVLNMDEVLSQSSDALRYMNNAGVLSLDFFESTIRFNQRTFEDIGCRRHTQVFIDTD